MSIHNSANQQNCPIIPISPNKSIKLSPFHRRRHQPHISIKTFLSTHSIVKEPTHLLHPSKITTVSISPSFSTRFPSITLHNTITQHYNTIHYIPPPPSPHLQSNKTPSTTQYIPNPPHHLCTWLPWKPLHGHPETDAS